MVDNPLTYEDLMKANELVKPLLPRKVYLMSEETYAECKRLGDNSLISFLSPKVLISNLIPNGEVLEADFDWCQNHFSPKMTISPIPVEKTLPGSAPMEKEPPLEEKKYPEGLWEVFVDFLKTLFGWR